MCRAYITEGEVVRDKAASDGARWGVLQMAYIDCSEFGCFVKEITKTKIEW